MAISPANGANDVDPATTELRVTFNVPMGGGFSWTGSGPNHPETTGRPYWTEDRKTCVLPVKLKPKWDYRLGLNSRSHKNFQSESGIPLEPVIYAFTTRGQAAEASAESNTATEAKTSQADDKAATLAVEKAQDAAKAWLSLVDNGKYAASWDETATAFRKVVTKADWEKTIKVVRAPFGAAKSRTVKTASFTETLPGAPKGPYVVIQYETQFENEKVIETVTPMRENDGSWKVSGYYCKPAEKNKAAIESVRSEQELATAEIGGQATFLIAADATVPQIVSMKPANDAKDVDPKIKELRVTFNVPMAAGFSWTGGGPNFPKTVGRPRWTKDRKTCVLPVQLKSGWSYQLGLNSVSFKNFQSESGVPLEPVVYQFKTRVPPPRRR